MKFITVSKFLLIVLSGIFLYGCKATMEDANKSYDLHEYAVAADKYNKVIRSGAEITREDKQVAAFRAGEAYRYNHDSKNALKMYAKAIRYGMKDPVVYLWQAKMLMEEGNYEEALVSFKEYKKMNPADERVDNEIAGCELALKCADKKTRYIIEDFRPANMSKVDDRVPRYGDRRKNTIMFTSDRPEGTSNKQFKWTGRNFEDFYVVTRESKKGKADKWSNPVLVEGFTAVNEGANTFDPRFSTMYFTQCNGLEGKEKTCKIYEAKKRGTTWEIQPDPLPFCNDSFNFGHPALSPDGNKLYFVSDMPGSLQDENRPEAERTKDIYVVNYVRRGRTWGEPINLGPTINTTGDEMFPYIHEDGTLYFSSDGQVTLGGLDILYSAPTGDGPTDWEKPVNMGCPMNSKADDFGIILDENKEHGFFSSNRGRGDDDIYEFSMTPLIFVLKGTITDCDTELPLTNAMVVIENDQDTSKIVIMTDSKGYYETPLKPEVNYEINVSKREDYYYDAEPKDVSTVGLDESTEFVKDFCLRNQCDDIFVLPIFYGLDSANLRTESKVVLDQLVEQMKKYPKMKVEFGSHTDCRENYEYNIFLSQRRADSAANYMINGGINPWRLEARGYGESKLVNHCACEGGKKVPCTEEEHQQNRRTEVKVVNCKYEFDIGSPEVTNYDTNAAALPEGGYIASKVIIQARYDFIQEYGKDHADEIKKAQEEQERLVKEAAEKELREKFDIIEVNEVRDKLYIMGMVGRKRIKFEYDSTSFKNEIPQSTVEQLFKTGDLSASDFKEGDEKIKLTDGTKLYSSSFKVASLKLGDVEFNDVKFKMVENNKPASLGNALFRGYKSVSRKGNMLYLEKN